MLLLLLQFSLLCFWLCLLRCVRDFVFVKEIGTGNASTVW